jgi:uncharacterized protein YyaL (SSP411 family)
LKNIYNEDNSLYRNFKNNTATIFAFLDDYAFLIKALIAYYQVTFNEYYLQKALSLAEYVEAHFFDKVSEMFFYTDDQHSNLIARKMEVTDNVIPSSNSEMARNLFLLGLYFENKRFEDQSVQLIKNILADAQKNMNYYSNWAQVLLSQIYPVTEIAITGNEWNEKLIELQQDYLPSAIYSGGAVEGGIPLLEDKIIKGKTMIYVCRNKTCGMPVQDAKDALQQIGY